MNNRTQSGPEQTGDRVGYFVASPTVGATPGVAFYTLIGLGHGYTTSGNVIAGGNIVAKGGTFTDPIAAPNLIVFQKGKAAFSSSTRKAIYQPGMLDTDSPIVGWSLTAEGSLTGGYIWCSPKTDSLIVQSQTSCSNQFAYQWGR